MTTKNTNTNEPIKTACYNCARETVQDILFQDHEIGPREIIFRTEEGDKSESAWEVVADIWVVSKCRGCERINFKHILRYSPERETDQTFYFPKNSIRRAPNWIVKLPMKYAEILQEIYVALNEQLFILSLTGIRTLLDVFIVSKIGDPGTFKQKLNKLVSDGIITTSKAKVLETTIDAGNASAHRGYKPDKDTLFEILDIVENLLQSEIVDRAAEQIRQKIPPRK
ncbi:MAG: DUF4145 domain-containing protein [Cyclobacteriaceae bacterium]